MLTTSSTHWERERGTTVDDANSAEWQKAHTTCCCDIMTNTIESEAL